MDGSGQRRLWWGLVIGAGVLALIALHLWIDRGVVAPRQGPGDQWGYLGNARFLGGAGPTYVLPRFPYFTFGYSLALVPAVRAFDDPERLFLAIKVTNAVLVSIVFPLLYLFARRVLRAARGPALAGAALGAVTPPLVAHTSSILAENLVLPLVVVVALACWAFLTERPGWQRVVLGPSVVALHLVHNRFILTLPLLLLLLLVAWWGRSAPGWTVAANAGLAATVLIAGQVVRQRLVEARWTYGIETPQGPASGFRDVFTEGTLAKEFLLNLVGQLWYVAVGTLGLAVLGIAFAVRTASRSSGSETAGKWRARAREVAADPCRLTLAFLLTSALGVLTVSTYFFTRVPNGAEGLIAGRHNDSFVPIWVAAGVVMLTSGPARREVRAHVAAAAAVIVALAALLLGGRGTAAFEHLVSLLNAPAVMHLSRHGAWLVPLASGAALLLLACLAAVAARRWAVPVVLGVAAVWLVGSVGSEVRPNPTVESWPVGGDLLRLDVRRAAVVQERNGGMPVYYQYFLPELEAVPWDGAGRPPEEMVFAPLDQPGLAASGARIAYLDGPIQIGFEPSFDLALWVLPGATQDALAGAGQLLPAGYPRLLPEEAQAADVVVDGLAPGGTVDVRSGAAVELELVGRHRGEGSPWPGGPASAAGRVVLSSIPSGTGPQPASAEARLPRWLLPGDPFRATLVIRAVDDDGRALPPGRYHLLVGLEQLGLGRFSDGAAEPVDVVLRVR